MPIAISLVLLAGIVCASVAFYLWRDTPPPSVPEVAQTVQIQEAVTSATSQVLTGRTTNDEAIKQAYENAKAKVDALSADAVVADLNVLLDELRGGSARQQ
jgi:predicted ATPase